MLFWCKLNKDSQYCIQQEEEVSVLLNAPEFQLDKDKPARPQPYSTPQTNLH